MDIVMCACGQKNRLTLKALVALEEIDEGPSSGKDVRCGKCHASIVDAAVADGDEDEEDDEDDLDEEDDA